jgi:hypothetical protein
MLVEFVRLLNEKEFDRAEKLFAKVLAIDFGDGPGDDKSFAPKLNRFLSDFLILFLSFKGVVVLPFELLVKFFANVFNFELVHKLPKVFVNLSGGLNLKLSS